MQIPIVFHHISKIPSVGPKIFLYTFSLSVNIWILSFRQSYFLEPLLILGPCFSAYIFFLSVIFLLLDESWLIDIFPSLFRMTPNVFIFSSFLYLLIVSYSCLNVEVTKISAMQYWVLIKLLTFYDDDLGNYLWAFMQ